MDNNSQEHLDQPEASVSSRACKIPMGFKRTARLGILFSQKSISFCLVYNRIKTPVIVDIKTESFAENETADSDTFLDHVIGKVHEYISQHNIQGIPNLNTTSESDFIIIPVSVRGSQRSSAFSFSRNAARLISSVKQ